MNDIVMTITEAAEYVGLAYSTLAQAVREGRVDSRLSGKRPLVTLKALEEAIEAGRIRPRRKEKEMMIKIKWSSASLWGSTDPDEYDWQQSEENYQDAVMNHLHDAYPDAQIEIEHGINDSVEVDGQPDHDEVPWVEQVLERVYNGDDWLVG